MKTRKMSNTDWIALGWQLVIFSCVGAFGTLAHYALLVILVELIGTDAVIGSMAGALLGAFVNYVLNYRITFNSSTSHRIALPKFLAVAATGFFINALLMWAAVHLTNLHYIIAQIITTVVVLLWNFTCNRFWTFRGEQNGATR